MPKYRLERDSNESPLIQLARTLGAYCERSPPFDWWVGYRGVWTVVEIKKSDVEGRAHEYTPKQRRLMAEYHQRGLPFWVWRTEADVMRDLKARRTA